MKVSDLNGGQKSHLSKAWNELRLCQFPRGIIFERIARINKLPVPVVVEYITAQKGYPGRIDPRLARPKPSLPAVRGVEPAP